LGNEEGKIFQVPLNGKALSAKEVLPSETTGVMNENKIVTDPLNTNKETGEK
jgi:hypothetical protein